MRSRTIGTIKSPFINLLNHFYPYNYYAFRNTRNNQFEKSIYFIFPRWYLLTILYKIIRDNWIHQIVEINLIPQQYFYSIFEINLTQFGHFYYSCINSIQHIFLLYITMRLSDWANIHINLLNIIFIRTTLRSGTLGTIILKSFL